jgi:UDP-glucuronate 4-epimerase
MLRPFGRPRGLLSECYLVTGSEGCLGSWVLARLLDAGARCIGLDLRAEGTRLRQLVRAELVAQIEFVVGDIVEEGLVERVVSEHGVSRVIHLAALQIPFVAAAPAQGAEVNVVGTVRVFEAAAVARAQVKGLAYASSAAVFDQAGALKPATLYGVFKLANEETARVFAEKDGVASIGLRPWAVFGPGRDQGLTAAPTHALKAVTLGESYRIPFGGRLDLQYARDVADAFIASALAPGAGARVANLRGSVVSVDEFIEVVDAVRPGAAQLLTHESEPIPIIAEPGGTFVDELLGEAPRTPLASAVRETLDHFEERARLGELCAADLVRD